MLAPHERIEHRDASGRVICYAPDYSIPGMAERIRREVELGELLASPLPANSSNMIYLLRTEGRPCT